MADREWANMTQTAKKVEGAPRIQRQLRLAICPTFTLEPQKNALQTALEQNVVDSVEIQIADIDTVEAELLNPESQTYQFKPDVILILWRFEDIASDLLFNAHGLETKKREAIYHQMIDRLDAIAKAYKGAAPLFLSTMPLPTPVNMPLNMAFGPAEILHRVNAHIHAIAGTKANIFVFDFFAWASGQGII